VGWQPEDLSSQIDGVKTLFTTTFAKDPGRLLVFHNGAQQGAAQFSEPNLTSIQLAFTPVAPDFLWVVYHTEQTTDGRVVGFPDDPTTIPGGIPQTLQDILDDHEARITALEGAAATVGDPVLEPFVPTAAQTVFTLAQSPILVRPVVLLAGGIAYTRERGDFTLGGVDDKTLTWTNPNVTFQVGDRIEVVHFS